MGKNNRARRAAKAKRRVQEHRPHAGRREYTTGSNPAPPPDDPRPTNRKQVAEFLAIPTTRAFDEIGVAGRVIDRVCALDPAIVREESERELLVFVGAAWTRGWQPTELIRQATRTTNTSIGRLAAIAIAGDHAARGTTTLDPRWIEQLDRLDIPQVGASTGWLGAWAERERVGWPDLVRNVVSLLAVLARIGRLPVLIPAPGARAEADPIIDLTARTNDPILNRVRALLAQAESTTFDEEAEAFTAKAQELMTRHAIDRAMVSAGADSSDRPLTIRIPVDDPYVEAKSLLLHCVAESSRCRSVFHPAYALASVVGYPADVAATEMLFTSLLVQAQTALQGAAASAPAGAHARSRAFRSAFLVAYAHRIAERLDEINADVIRAADAAAGHSLLPVLAARSAGVDSAVDEMFGPLATSTVGGGHDAAGWAGGTLAAERARLTSGELTSSDLTSAFGL